jgi:hypothetical protein
LNFSTASILLRASVSIPEIYLLVESTSLTLVLRLSSWFQAEERSAKEKNFFNLFLAPSNSFPTTFLVELPREILLA